MNNFKNKHTFDRRVKESQRILEKYPDRFPIIIEKHRKCDFDIDKNKYLDVFWNNQLNCSFGLSLPGIALIPAVPFIICRLKTKNSPKMLINNPDATIVLITFE